MKLYLAGPMTGYKDLNHPLFHAETARLRALGYTIINPAEINGDQTAKWEDCMRQDIAQLVTCAGIALLPMWTTSKGARLEAYIATQLGLTVKMASELQRRPYLATYVRKFPAITLRCHDSNLCAAGQRPCPSPSACGVEA